MTGLDTNILVRYLTQDDPEQAEQATREIETGAAQGESFFITSIVMCELDWVLETAYGYSRDDIASVLGQILQTRQFVFENKDLMRLTFMDYQQDKADFSDYLIGRTGNHSGCTETLTFDAALKDKRLFRLL